MNTYLVASDTNYGLMVHVVNAATPEEARQLAEAAGAWPHADITLIDTAKPGVVAYEQARGG